MNLAALILVSQNKIILNMSNLDVIYIFFVFTAHPKFVFVDPSRNLGFVFVWMLIKTEEHIFCIQLHKNKILITSSRASCYFFSL